MGYSNMLLINSHSYSVILIFLKISQGNKQATAEVDTDLPG